MTFAIPSYSNSTRRTFPLSPPAQAVSRDLPLRALALPKSDASQAGSDHRCRLEWITKKITHPVDLLRFGPRLLIRKSSSIAS